MTLCDIGNTTFSFSTNKKKFKINIDSKWYKLPKIKDDIYFISVNDKATNKFLKKYPKAINCESLFSFPTKYNGMGIDRQVACSFVKNGIIVDVGSAITVDIMKNSRHKGGFILPGVSKLTSFYPLISSKLKLEYQEDSLNHFEKKVNLDKMPVNTEEAIIYAILQSIVLPIKECQNRYSLPIYFTGEDSKHIREYFKKKNYIYKKNLIFSSMKKIIKRKNRC